MDRPLLAKLQGLVDQKGLLGWWLSSEEGERAGRVISNPRDQIPFLSKGQTPEGSSGDKLPRHSSLVMCPHRSPYPAVQPAVSPAPQPWLLADHSLTHTSSSQKLPLLQQQLGLYPGQETATGLAHLHTLRTPGLGLLTHIPSPLPSPSGQCTPAPS